MGDLGLTRLTIARTWFKEEPNGLKVEFSGIIEEILEVDFRNFMTLLIKVQWFCNTT
jgi:hypothetical protein